jgi:hypothetical protein
MKDECRIKNERLRMRKKLKAIGHRLKGEEMKNEE